MRDIIHLTTQRREELVDITARVAAIVKASGVRQGVAAVYAQGATAALMIQENWDESVQTDVVNLLRQLIPRGVWLHDEQDGNGDAHLKRSVMGREVVVAVTNGALDLGPWEQIFYGEFDGLRRKRVLIKIIGE